MQTERVCGEGPIGNFVRNRNRWSIAVESAKILFEAFDLAPNKKSLNIIEFGSGASTYLLLDCSKYYECNINNFVSFENKPIYAPDLPNVLIRPLMTCDDDVFEDMFEKRIYMPQKMRYYFRKPTSKQRNCFYKVNHDDLPDRVDVMLLDGPNGNGRSMAFLHVKDILHEGSLIFIDNYNDYDFLERLSLFCDYDVLRKRDVGRDQFVALFVKCLK